MSLNKQVYLLEHAYDYGEDKEHMRAKILGVYYSKEEALFALEGYYQLKDFNEYPKDCFTIDKYNLDKDTGWKEGFIDSDDYEFDESLWQFVFKKEKLY